MDRKEKQEALLPDLPQEPEALERCDREAIKKAWHIYRDPGTADVTKRVMVIALDQLIKKL